MPLIKSFEIDNKVIALTGVISGKLPIHSLCEFHKPSILLVNSNYGHLNEQAIEWALKHNIKFCVERNMEKMVELADVIFVYYDYIPSSYDYVYGPEEPQLDKTSIKILKYADEKQKPYLIDRVEKIYHFQFIIKEEDRDVSTEHFTIDIESKDMVEQGAKAKAIAEAQLKYIHYVNDFNKYQTLYFHLCIENGNYWKEIDTAEIEKWYNSTIIKYS